MAAFVVWTPELGAHASNVPGGMALVPDSRAQHYWNPSESLGRAYEHVLLTPGPAWDVYMVFRRGVRWNSTMPPKPDYWMHQLGGVTSAPRLDPAIFKEHVESILNA